MSMMHIDRENYDEFLVGRRILVVDDDPVGLKFVESMLRRCEFHVTAVSQAIMAIKLLREDKDQFDLVIIKVHIPDVDGFKSLQITGLEMDLPAIMVSASCDLKIVMKGITHGDREYLLKPVRIEELKNIWQHILTGKTFGKDSPFMHMGSLNGLGDFRPSTGQGSRLTDATLSSPHASAEIENFNGSDDPSAPKKSRFLWTSENRRKFLEAAKLSGFEKAAPERVLELMNVEGLTLEEVARHLHRYILLCLHSAETKRATVAVLEYKDSLFRKMSSLDDLKEFRALTGQDDHQMVFPQNLEYFFCKCGETTTLRQYFKFHGMALKIGVFGTVFEEVVGCYSMSVVPICNSELLFCKKCDQHIGYKYQSASRVTNFLLFTGQIRVKYGLNMVLTLEEYLPSLLAQE